MMTGSRGLPPPTPEDWRYFADAVKNMDASIGGRLEELRSREATIEAAQRDLDKQRADFANEQTAAEVKRKATLAKLEEAEKDAGLAMAAREDAIKRRERDYEEHRRALEAAARALLK